MRYRDRVDPPRQGNNPRFRNPRKPPGDVGINPPSQPPISIPDKGDAWTDNPVVNLPTIPEPEPPTPIISDIVSTTKPYQVKPASKDVILFDDEAVDVEVMVDLIFEDIGGNELINLSRFDLIAGNSVEYQPIKNLTYIKQKYGPNNLFALQNTSDKLFGNFPIKLNNKIDPSTILNNIYLDGATGDIIVEFVNMIPDEEIEIQVATNGIIDEVG